MPYDNIRFIITFRQRQTVVIDDALASEASEVQIEVELLCGCDCKNIESSYCEHGVNECGICKCDFGWSGRSTQCFFHTFLYENLFLSRLGYTYIFQSREIFLQVIPAIVTRVRRQKTGCNVPTTGRSVQTEANAFAVFVAVIRDTMGASANVPLATKYEALLNYKKYKMIKSC